MLLLVGNDLANHGRCRRIARGNHAQLILEMGQNDALDGFRRQGDRSCAQQTSDKSKREPTKPAQMEAPAAPNSPASQFIAEQRAMALLVAEEFLDLREHSRRSPPGDPSLSPVDTDGPVFAGVINLQGQFPGCAGRSGAQIIHSYGA